MAAGIGNFLEMDRPSFLLVLDDSVALNFGFSFKKVYRIMFTSFDPIPGTIVMKKGRLLHLSNIMLILDKK